MPELKLVTVPDPAPGKVCPAANVIMPVLPAMESPLLAGVQGALLQNWNAQFGVVPSCAMIRNKWSVDPVLVASMSKGKEAFCEPVAETGIKIPPAPLPVLPMMFMPVKVLA